MIQWCSWLLANGEIEAGRLFEVLAGRLVDEVDFGLVRPTFRIARRDGEWHLIGRPSELDQYFDEVAPGTPLPVFTTVAESDRPVQLIWQFEGRWYALRPIDDDARWSREAASAYAKCWLYLERVEHQLGVQDTPWSEDDSDDPSWKCFLDPIRILLQADYDPDILFTGDGRAAVTVSQSLLLPPTAVSVDESSYFSERWRGSRNQAQALLEAVWSDSSEWGRPIFLECAEIVGTREYRDWLIEGSTLTLRYCDEPRPEARPSQLTFSVPARSAMCAHALKYRTWFADLDERGMGDDPWTEVRRRFRSTLHLPRLAHHVSIELTGEPPRYGQPSARRSVDQYSVPGQIFKDPVKQQQEVWGHIDRLCGRLSGRAADDVRAYVLEPSQRDTREVMYYSNEQAISHFVRLFVRPGLPDHLLLLPPHDALSYVQTPIARAARALVAWAADLESQSYDNWILDLGEERKDATLIRWRRDDAGGIELRHSPLGREVVTEVYTSWWRWLLPARSRILQRGLDQLDDEFSLLDGRFEIQP